MFMNDQLRETDQLKFKSSSLSSRYEQYQVTSFLIHFIKVGPFLLSSRKCRLLTVAPRKNLGLCPSSLHSAIESPRHPLDGCPHPNGAINDPKEKKEGKESYCIVGEGTKIGELPIS